MKANQLLDPFSYSIGHAMNYLAVAILSMFLAGYFLQFIPTHDLFVYLLVLFWISWAILLLMYRLHRYWLRTREDVLFYQIQLLGIHPPETKYIVGGLVWIITIICQIYLIVSPPHSNMIEKFFLFISMDFFCLVNSFHEFCLHRDGLFYSGCKYSWDEVENFAWQRNEPDLLILQMRPSHATYTDRMKRRVLKWQVPSNQKKHIEKIIASRGSI